MLAGKLVVLVALRRVRGCVFFYYLCGTGGMLGNSFLILL